MRQIRAYFDARGLLEVDTPVLSADVVVDRHLDPFSTVLASDPRAAEVGRRLWLQTSPEFHMKRLLAAGSGPIYQISRVFRNGEAGRLHNPEFTMIEWYLPGMDYAAGREMLSEFAAEHLGRGGVEQMTYREAFQRHLQVDPRRATIDALIRAARSANVSIPQTLARDDRDGWLDLLLADCVQPHLGQDRPLILYDYPASQAALAQVAMDAEGVPVAQRFELYVSGIELANGYHELLDAGTLRDRNRASNEQRRRDGKPPLPEESRLLAAMEAGLPPSIGIALGFDRLLMLVAGLSSIGEAIPFPIDEA